MNRKTQVVVVGAGASGLTAAALFKRCGISCIVLERSSRQYVEERQRAGNLDARSVRIFEEWGLADQVVGGAPYHGVTELRINDEPRELCEQLSAKHGESSARMCPQQVLIRNLLDVIDRDGTDLRFEAEVMAISGLEAGTPVVTYRDSANTEHRIECTIVAGCDGFHGVSRRSIPDGVLTRHAYDYGISWLNVLMEAAPRIRMSIGRSGFAAQFPRGMRLGRFYLQIENGETEKDWPDARIRDELAKRMGDLSIANCKVLDRQVFQLRAEVFEPMRYRNLFLVGDAAHIISPIPGKGMNLALYDASAFVSAAKAYLIDGDAAALEGYSDHCLHRVWNYQEFSAWCTSMLHDPSDMTRAGSFHSKLAIARLERLLSSEDANRAYSELMAGFA